MTYLRCIVAGCPAGEKQLKDGISVWFKINGGEGSGRVCEAHKHLVVENQYTAYSTTPPTLIPIPAEETTNE